MRKAVFNCLNFFSRGETLLQMSSKKMSAHAGQTALPGGLVRRGCFCCPVEHWFTLGRAVLATRSSLKATYNPFKVKKRKLFCFPTIAEDCPPHGVFVFIFDICKAEAIGPAPAREGRALWLPRSQRDREARQHPSRSSCWGCKAQLCTESSCWDQPDMAWFCARRSADIYRAFHRDKAVGEHMFMLPNFLPNEETHIKVRDSPGH